MPKRQLSIGAGLILGIFSVIAITVIVAPKSAQAAIVNVTCNNTTADATTLQNAINASTVKDIVNIHGPCLINATVKLLDNRTYQGDGRGATIVKMANGSNLSALLATNTWSTNSTSTNTAITLQHLTLDGNKANNGSTPTGSAVLQFRAWDSMAQDIEINNAPRDAIRISNASANGTALAGTSVNGTIKDFFIQSTGEIPIHVVDAGNSLTDWNIQDGWIAGSGTGFDGIKLENSAGWQVHNVHLYGISANAINMSRCYGTRVTNNYIEGFGAQATSGGWYDGIYCRIQGDATSVIANNSVNQFNTTSASVYYNFIEISGNYGSPVISVTGNTARGGNTTHETGLFYGIGGASTMTVASAGNVIDSVATQRFVDTNVTVTAGQ